MCIDVTVAEILGALAIAAAMFFLFSLLSRADYGVWWWEPAAREKHRAERALAQAKHRAEARERQKKAEEMDEGTRPWWAD